ncbi:hypothetical protein M9H77_11385 [Catharanthus roseus]|uniref:Uncharacterized protein n=1 Tax=Catharanthus roseus TaxID=4058 RepID=A0ACC0BEF9_CATRO|nr:hypothetical protein M9H77_11385 [Catharanthus roseus]
MDLGKPKFGSGEKELCGAVDLLSHYKLWPHHEIFCKRSVAVSVSESPYLRNVVGDKRIRKGEGMELDELLHEETSSGRQQQLPTFELDSLRDAFRITEMTSWDHSYCPFFEQAERTMDLLSASKLKKTGNKNELKHKRHEDRSRKKKKKNLKKKHKQHHNLIPKFPSTY